MTPNTSRTGHSIHTIEIGPMQNLIYVLKDEATERCAVIDPAWDVPAIEKLATDINATITDVLLTHSHNDHINGLNELLTRHNVPVHISKTEYEFWGNTALTPKLYKDEDVIQLGKTKIRVLQTAGHTPGSVCFHVGDDLICGDTLFVFGCGRCDLKGGDAKQLFHSLQTLKDKIPPNTTIYPGHNYAIKPTCTMAEQLVGNPFLHIKDADTFSEYRMTKHGETRSYPFAPLSENELIGLL